MRAHDELDRLSAAWQPFLADADAIVGAGEERRILGRILTSPRPARRLRPPRLRVALVGVAVVAAAVATAAIELGPGNRSATEAGGGHRGLTGAKIQLAGYHFRTPAGYKASADPCSGAQFWAGSGLPGGYRPSTPAPDSFAAAASADGGCILASLLGGGSSLPTDATAVPVGSYDGFVAVAPAGSQEALYVELPATQGDRYLLLLGQGLTTQQLVSIAESGLPASS